MNSMLKKVLLACFDFPPNAGIGGRRWAKFAKGLANQGVEVYVIKAAPIKGQEQSGWSEDILHDLIHVHELPRTYPSIVSHGPKNVVDKVRYKLEISKLQRQEPGTIYDIAIGWERKFLAKAEALIEKEGIINIIATGAPFNILYYAALLKSQNRELNLIVDYRDPWLTAQNYGMKDLSRERMEAETAKQELVFRHANWVVCPNKFLLTEIRNTAISKPKAQFTALPHFFDPDDLAAYLLPISPKNEIKIVYGGSIYLGIEDHLMNFAESLKMLKTKNITLYNRLNIQFYTPQTDFAKVFKEVDDIVEFSQPIGKDFFKQLNEASAAIVMLASHNKNYLTTKFFEYLPFRKPLLFLGVTGYTSEFIEENKLGLILTSDGRDLEENLLSLTHPWATENPFQIDEFSLNKRIYELMRFIK
ncbi:MAG: hypothetical protein ACI80P_000409 [Flavobacteriales bacterium]|jgi:hypothetical protein